MAYNLEDTIVAIATAAGEAALGIVRLSGDKAIKIADSVFHPSGLREKASHTVHYGYIKDGDSVVDEVLLTLFKSPRSFTTEDLVEISCHGSPYILQQVLELLIRSGARHAMPGEFTYRAFMNGRLDLSQAEAVADLIAAQSSATHDIALRQMRGGFSNRIAYLREQLIDFAALVELELDFGEEDVEFANRQKLVDLIDEIRELNDALIESFRLGNVIRNGVSTVIAGRPNAGKSTLLNALLNEERAIVSEIPGTTRDTIEEQINIGGIIFRLIDTAGIRDATDVIEHIGVQKTMESISRSAILLYVFDVTALSPEELKSDLEKLGRDDLPVLILGNKIDLLDEGEANQRFSLIKDILFISSSTHLHLEELKESLKLLVWKGQVNADQPIITNARHYEALRNADEALQRVLEGIEGQVSGELLAFDIREALDYMGEITGEVITNDDVLGSIFGRFCIGK